MNKIILLFSTVIFGLVTLFMSSSVLFDWFGIREKEGNFVPVVVWLNWFCGILYLIAAFGIAKNRSSAKIPLILSLVLLFAGYLYLFMYITNDGLYETKTLMAMGFRIAVTLTLLFSTIKIFKK